MVMLVFIKTDDLPGGGGGGYGGGGYGQTGSNSAPMGRSRW